MRAAVLYARYTELFSYFDDWLDAFEASTQFDTHPYDIASSSAAARFETQIDEFDVIITLHSMLGDSLDWMERIASSLANRKCILFCFIGNEVNLPGIRIADKRALLKKLEPDYIATQLILEAGEFLFSDLAKVGVVALPHALNPQTFKSNKASHERNIDIGVRTARYLPHLGDEDRNRITDYFKDHARALGLKVDISDVRMNRQGWVNFLNNSRATVATEAGSWFLERDDHTVENIRAWIDEKSKGTYLVSDSSKLLALYGRIPTFLKRPLKLLKNSGFIAHELSAAQEANFSEIYEKFFKDYEKPKVYGKCISSRHFDAIGTKTVQIMFPGRYNDILTPGKHYIELDSDFGNVDEVIETLRDETLIREITEAAYSYILDKHTYAARVRNVFKILSAT